jgi:hypothetical protein
MGFTTADGRSVEVRGCGLQFERYPDRIEFEVGSYTNYLDRCLGGAYPPSLLE